LSFDGHADDSTVCAAISILVSTLYVGYGGHAPPGSGDYIYDALDTDSPAVDFVCRAVRILEFKHSGEIRYSEVA